jgi:non-specific serine/threonine protein kinase
VADSIVDLGIPGLEGAVPIGRGGFAIVYRSYQADFNRTVAVKVLTSGGSDEALLRRFETERSALGAFSDHPAIVTVHDWGVTGDGAPYLVMEHMAGGSLAERISKGGSLSEEEALAVALPVADALATAHSAAVVHRDVKPQNILFSSYGEPKLSDFGVAVIAGDPATGPGALSVDHAAPEVVQGQPATEASDVYSLGSTIYTMLAGRAPFAGEGTLQEHIARILEGEPRELKQLGISAALSGVVHQALATNRDARFSTAEAFSEALERAGSKAPPGDDPASLPAFITSFIGRRSELAAIAVRLQEDRLVTLTGVGGVGKTRLAVEVASRTQASYADGVRLARFGQVRRPERALIEVAKGLGLTGADTRPVREDALDYLQTREVLLILDNCEHVLDAIAPFVDEALRGAPGLRVLATSREPLGVDGEARWPVPPMSAPDVGESGALRGFDAVELFVDRARKTWPDFELDESNAADVAAICSRLDGIPLAIELAASRLGLLSPGDIAANLDDRFHLLVTQSRTALPRHQTMEATINWSYELLDESQQTLLRRLAVFRGGFTLEAVQDVCSDEAMGRLELVDGLGHLGDASLIVVDRLPHIRYRMLETVREFAASKLADAGEEEMFTVRHLRYFSGLADDLAPRILGYAAPVFVTRVAPEMDNMRRALDVALARGSYEDGASVAEVAYRVWISGGLLAEGRRYYAALLEGSDHMTPSRYAKTLSRAAVFDHSAADNERAIDYLERAQSIFSEDGDAVYLAATEAMLGMLYLVEGDADAARSLLNRVLRNTVEIGVLPGQATAHRYLGLAAYSRGAYDEAVSHYEEAVETWHRAEDSRGAGWTESLLSLALTRSGDPERGMEVATHALELLADVPRSLGSAFGHLGIGEAAGALGKVDLARAELGKSIDILRDLHYYQSLPPPLIALADLLATNGRRQEAAEVIGIEAGTRDRSGIKLLPSDEARLIEISSGVEGVIGADQFEAAHRAGLALDGDAGLERAMAIADGMG